MAREPAARYASAKAFADDVQAYLEDGPIAAFPLGRLRRALKWTRRHALAVSAVSIGLVVAAATVVTVAILWRSANRSLAQNLRDRARQRLEEKDALCAEILLANALAHDDTPEARGLLYAARRARLVFTMGYTGVEVGWSPPVDEQARWNPNLNYPNLAPADFGTAIVHGRWFAGRNLGGPGRGGVAICDLTAGPASFRILDGVDSIAWLALSPDGKRMVTRVRDEDARVRDVASGARIATLERSFDEKGEDWDREHPPYRPYFGFCPDGSRVVAAGWWNGPTRGFVKVWDAATGKVVREVAGLPRLRHVTVSPDGRLAASLAPGDPARDDRSQVPFVCDLETGATFALRPKSGEFPLTDQERFGAALGSVVPTPEQGFGIAFSPDGARLAIVGREAGIRVFDVKTKEEVASIAQGGCGALAWSPDARRLATGGNRVLVFDAETGRRELELHGWNYTRAVAFSADGRRLAAASDDLRVFELLGPPSVGWSGGAFVLAAMSGDGRRCAGVLPSGRTRILDLETGRELLSLDSSYRPNRITIDREGRRFAATAGVGVEVWDVATAGAPLATLQTGSFPEIALSPDGKLLAASSSTQSDFRGLHLRDVETAKEVGFFEEPGGVQNIVWSRDGNQLAFTDWDYHKVFVWDTGAPGPRLIVNGTFAQFLRLELSSDGRMLAACQNGRVVVWNVEDGAVLFREEPSRGPGPSPDRLVFSPDRKWLAAQDRAEHVFSGRVWDTRTWRLAAAFTESAAEGPFVLGFTKDGRLRRVFTSSGHADALDVDELVRFHAASPQALLAESEERTGLRVVGGEVVHAVVSPEPPPAAPSGR
jgi:WD40 repeat protein